MTDVTRRVEHIMGELSYSGEVAGNMRAALLARLEGLLIGNRGLMLDTRESLPDHGALFDARVVVELEAIGDDDDKCFLMGLLLIRLAEYRRMMGPSRELKHVLVIEEAHRLLSAASESNQAGFGIAEGQGRRGVHKHARRGPVLRPRNGDRRPSAHEAGPEVLKNTNLKIAHRTVARDDREALAATMAMDDDRSLALATLKKGEAGVFAEGDDAPLLIAVTKKSLPGPPTEALLRERFVSWTGRLDLEWGATAGLGVGREAAKRLAASEQTLNAVVRMVVSAQHETFDHLREMYGDLTLRLDRDSPPGADVQSWRSSVLNLTTSQLVVEMSAAHGWTYDAASRARELLMVLLDACGQPGQSGVRAVRPWCARGPAKDGAGAVGVATADPSACPTYAQGCCPYVFAAGRLLRQPRWRQSADQYLADFDSSFSTMAAEELRVRLLNNLCVLAQEIVRVPAAWDAPGERPDMYRTVTEAARCLWQQLNLTRPCCSAVVCPIDQVPRRHGRRLRREHFMSPGNDRVPSADAPLHHRLHHRHRSTTASCRRLRQSGGTTTPPQPCSLNLRRPDPTPPERLLPGRRPLTPGRHRASPRP